MKLFLLITLLAVGLVSIFFFRQRNKTQATRHFPEASANQLGKTLNQAHISQAKADIKDLGWHIAMVNGQGAPGFLYTVGLWESYKHPEILLFALSENPAGMEKRLAEIVENIARGERFESGESFKNLFGEHAGATREVLPRWVPRFLMTAGAVYGNFDFPVVQLYWPDNDGLFPWQSGFNPELFDYQPILHQSNLVLANMGFHEVQKIVSHDGPQVLETALEELLFKPQDIAESRLIEDWRWRVGPEPELFRMTRFGDLFLKTPNGHIHWLDTGSNVYEEIATNQETWLRIICEDLATFFHASTLLHFRALEFFPGKGEVYSWRLPPILGGTDTVDNFDLVSAFVHVSNAGRTAKGAQSGAPETSGFDADSDTTIYTVVINSEKQYSIWPHDKDIPSGWKSAEKTGTKQECIEFIEKVWVDMRPESLRKKREAEAKKNQE